MMRLHNAETGITFYVPEPGEPDYTAESEEFQRHFMESKPGDKFDTSCKKRLRELAAEWDRIQARQRSEAEGQLPNRRTPNGADTDH